MSSILKLRPEKIEPHRPYSRENNNNNKKVFQNWFK